MSSVASGDGKTNWLGSDITPKNDVPIENLQNRWCDVTKNYDSWILFLIILFQIKYTYD